MQVTINRNITTSELLELVSLMQNQETTDKYTNTSLHINGNHAEIEATNHDDSLIQVLDILKTSIKEQMPHLHVVDDTNDRDEKDILADMEKFITYRLMCLNYIVGKDYSKQQKKVAGYLKIPSGDIDNVIVEATKHYKI